MSSSSDGHRPQGIFSEGKFLEKCPHSCVFFPWFCVHRPHGVFFGGAKKIATGFLWFTVIRAMNVHICMYVCISINIYTYKSPKMRP